jgi:hypothetical protein
MVSFYIYLFFSPLFYLYPFFFWQAGTDAITFDFFFNRTSITTIRGLLFYIHTEYILFHYYSICSYLLTSTILIYRLVSSKSSKKNEGTKNQGGGGKGDRKSTTQEKTQEVNGNIGKSVIHFLFRTFFYLLDLKLFFSVNILCTLEIFLPFTSVSNMFPVSVSVKINELTETEKILYADERKQAVEEGVMRASEDVIITACEKKQTDYMIPCQFAKLTDQPQIVDHCKKFDPGWRILFVFNSN